MIDAAQLAAGAPPGGVLLPADEKAELAYLDLRKDAPAVAGNKAKAVAKAFGPSLHLQASLRLVVASGQLDPSTIANWFACMAVPGQRSRHELITAVRGENVLGRLEELMLAGCDLGKASGSGEPPFAAWAPAPAPVLREAIATDAALIVSRYAAPQAIATAAEAEANAGGLTLPASLPVDLVFADGYELPIEVASREASAAVLELVSTAIKERCTISHHECVDLDRVVVSAERLADLCEFAERFELAAPAGTLRSPLTEAITPRCRQETTTAPADLLEFGIDARPSEDWREA